MSLSSTNLHDFVIDNYLKLIIIDNMTSQRKTMTLKLTNEQLIKMRELALSFGFEAERGPLAGTGSVQQMIEAVANGDYNIAIWPDNDNNA